MQSIFFDISLIGYAVATMAGFIGLLVKSRGVRTFAYVVMLCGFVSQVSFIIQRWILAGRPALSNTFETMIFFSASVVLTFLVMDLFHKLKAATAGIAMLALLLTAYATLFETDIKPLVPALQNNFWLTVHVTLCFVGYAGFAISFLFAIVYLVRMEGVHRAGATFVLALILAGLCCVILVHHLAGQDSLGEVSESQQWTISKNVSFVVLLWLGGTFLFWGLLWSLIQITNVTDAIPENFPLEPIIYKAIAFGFPFLGMGILSGAVWANIAWGRYWGWDPKETWSLITWLIYALYLHLRFIAGWKGAMTAWVSVAGFLAVMFTYYGVNYLLVGLHAYA